jgi:hypothetical protein
MTPFKLSLIFSKKSETTLQDSCIWFLGIYVCFILKQKLYLYLRNGEADVCGRIFQNRQSSTVSLIVLVRVVSKLFYVYRLHVDLQRCLRCHLDNFKWNERDVLDLVFGMNFQFSLLADFYPTITHSFLKGILVFGVV